MRKSGQKIALTFLFGREKTRVGSVDQWDTFLYEASCDFYNGEDCVRFQIPVTKQDIGYNKYY